MEINEIDNLHQNKKLEKVFTADEIYQAISENPLRYLFVGQYLIKFVFIYLIPFIIWTILINQLELRHPSEELVNITYAFTIWFFFNKNTIYTLIKINMIFFSFFPSMNIYYLSTGEWFSEKFIRILLGISLSLITIPSIIYNFLKLL